MKDLLFVSNGHGEDVVACKVLDCIRAGRPELAVEAWPMVGEGSAYKVRGVPTTGTLNLLPSAGFATLDRNLMIGDLKAGWIGTHWRQFKDARALRGRYRMLVAVGDIIPISVGVLSRTPFQFIGCAKSSYYDPFHSYTRLEKRLLRRHCLRTFPRDFLTTKELDRARVPNTYLGNPMMDGLDGTGDRLGIPEGNIVVGMLAGTRADAETNLLDLFAAAARVHHHHPEPARIRFVFAARSELDPQEVMTTIVADPRFCDWNVKELSDQAEGVVLRLAGPAGMETVIAKGRFADVLHMSDIVVGMAGTANEQAIGLGIPLVTAPSSGVQGEQYVKMKMKFFGESAVAVARDPDEIARAVGEILGDPERRARMAAAGRERMGEPGASRAIADEVLKALDGLRRGSAAR
jgi:uncharacterized protein (TIGR03492 family)